jgi:hypothetical protein
MRTSQKTPATISTIGIDIGKNTFQLVGLDKCVAIVLQQKVRLSTSLLVASPPRSARWNEEMDERSARRNHETGCQNGPPRSCR